MTGEIDVFDGEALLSFSFDDMLRYAGPGSPAGVAVAYQAMRCAFPLLDSEKPVQRREVTIETAFRGPGARDGFELVTRGLTDGRYIVTADLEHPERGTTLAQFVFRFLYRDQGRATTLLVKEPMVTDEFITLARTENRTPDEEQHFTDLKQSHAELLLATRPEDVFDIAPG